MPKVNIHDYAEREARKLFREIMQRETRFDTPERVLTDILDGVYNDEVKGKGAEAINSGVNLPMSGVTYQRVDGIAYSKMFQASLDGDFISKDLYWYEAWEEYIEEQVLKYLIKMAERRLSRLLEKRDQQRGA